MKKPHEALVPVRAGHWTTADQERALAAALEAMPDIGFMSRWLALCSMPRTHPGTRVRYRRTNGPWTLTMTASGTVGLPYGTLPRLLLAWVCTEAVRRQSRTVQLGRSLDEFMRELGMRSRSGGERGDRTRLRNQMDRLFRTTVELSYRDSETDEFIASRIADRAQIMWSLRRPSEPVLWESYIRLGEAFYSELSKYPLPVDMNVLKAMKRSSLGLDLYLWLTYRVFGLSEVLTVSWRQLYGQFAPRPDAAERLAVEYFRRKVLRELEKLSLAWPGLRWETVRGRLVVRPSQTLIVARRVEALRLRPGDTPHEALRRHVVRLLSEDPALARVGSDLPERIKTAAARAGLSYDSTPVQRAISAGVALVAKRKKSNAGSGTS